MALVDDCNTLTTVGFNLQDLPAISDKVKEAVKLHAQDNEFKDFPKEFSCSHCGNEHALTPEQIQYALFRGPGAYDFVASANEYLAILNQVPASSIGEGETNSFVDNSTFDVSEVINPATAIEDPKPDSKPSTKSEKAK